MTLTNQQLVEEISQLTNTQAVDLAKQMLAHKSIELADGVDYLLAELHEQYKTL